MSISLKIENTKEQKYEEARSIASRDFRVRRIGSGKDQLLPQLRTLPHLLLIGVTAASLIGLLLLPPISQDQSYHDFADQRTLLGIPNLQ